MHVAQGVADGCAQIGGEGQGALAHGGDALHDLTGALQERELVLGAGVGKQALLALG